MSDSLFDIYQNIESEKELRDSLEAKYIADNASSKKFLVSNFNNYKMVDSRPVMKQYNELLGIPARFTQHKMNMDEVIQVSCVIDKRSPSRKDFKHTLKHKKEELTLVELSSHVHIEESPRAYNSDKPKSKNVVGSSVVNMVEHNDYTSGKPGHLKKDCRDIKVRNKANGSCTNGSGTGSCDPMKDNDVACDLCDLHATSSLKNKKYFVTFIDDASGFRYVNLLHSKDEALDKFKVVKTEVELQQGALIYSVEP
ncbi:hypothetical protein Tco_0655461 [Tanacetum coccineum]|uniref:Polyprotein n=1 Tax=Tanacetum coccineum TaxID=301880 RepID=A0ABQ4X634_9ASTR